jgi:hypothetical protein
MTNPIDSSKFHDLISLARTRSRTSEKGVRLTWCAGFPFYRRFFTERCFLYQESDKSKEAGCPFFDFLASHDGIALLPAKEILRKEDLDGLLKLRKVHGALISSGFTGNGEEPTVYSDPDRTFI